MILLEGSSFYKMINRYIINDIILMATILITDTDAGMVNNEFHYLLWFQPSLWGIIIKKESINIYLDSRYFSRTETIDTHKIQEQSGKKEVFFYQTRGDLVDNLIYWCHESTTKKLENNINLKYYEAFKEKSDNSLSISQVSTIEPYFAKKRITKSESEIKNIKKAIAIIDKVFSEVKKLSASGKIIWKTEKEIHAFIVSKIFEFGGSGESFEAVVAFGPNSAIPHHEAWETIISNGPLLIDMWAIYNGYCSDFTRTFWVGEKTDDYKEWKHIYDSVKKAYYQAFFAAKVWKHAQDIDAKARHSIAKDGYGESFTHSTWHGIGINVHERPWINKKSDEKIKTDMVFTIEPGIYLKWKFGVRIENIVFMWSERAKCFSEIDF